MSSELDNVKNTVQQAASCIDDAATATQTAWSNADSKKERLGAMGQVSMHQGLEQAVEKLQNAWQTIGTAHGDANKADTELRNVADTMPIPEALPKLGSAVSELATSKTHLDGAAELVSGAKTDAEAVGVKGIAGQCGTAQEMIDTARTTLDTASNAVSEYQKRLEQEAEDLDDLNTTPNTTSPTSTPSAPSASRSSNPGQDFTPAGEWVPTPQGERHFGNDFNQRYEAWVKKITGGPDGKEYLAKGNGERAHFDATTIENRNGQKTEVLIDAKGRYAQFVNKKTGDFHSFFQNRPGKGIDGMLDDADRQVKAADGSPVEWWCAEEAAADAFDDQFDQDPRLRGRIEAVYKPMPNETS